MRIVTLPLRTAQHERENTLIAGFRFGLHYCIAGADPPLVFLLDDTGKRELTVMPARGYATNRDTSRQTRLFLSHHSVYTTFGFNIQRIELKAGTPMWEASRETGAAIHSNSWGYSWCEVGEETYYNDKFLFDVRGGSTLVVRRQFLLY